MKHLSSLFLALTMPIMLMAANKYVTPNGDNSAAGSSWATAYETIQNAINAAGVGDTVFIAAGTYTQGFSIKDGVHVFGGYNSANGMRDVEGFETILDGSTLGKWLVVKYDGGCTNPTVIDGITFQNADHGSEGGCAFIRSNVTLNHCIIRNCTTSSSAGGVMMEGGGTVSNCTIELCSSGSSGGAIYNKGGVVENCIIRGNQGKYAAIRCNAGIVRNCVVYNNEATVSSWPNSGGIYNPGGVVINCTLANNKGEGYAGIHSDENVYNTICWGNEKEEGFADPENYIAKGSHNAYDHGFGSGSIAKRLSANNLDVNGPNFVAPTTFKGLPKNAGEIAAMRAADFRLAPQSPCLDLGLATEAPATDICGVARPKGTGVDLGAYEYDPNAQAVAVTGVRFTSDTLRIHEEEVSGAAYIVSPGNATNKNVTFASLNAAIASVSGTTITGVAVGTTRVVVTTADGGFKDTIVVVVDPKPVVIIHHEVLEADALYPQANYTVPSFTPFYVAKELARKDSSEANLQALRDAIPGLVDYRMPYNVVATINGDPKTQMAFTWFTNGGVTAGDVQIVEGENKTEADFAQATTITAEATTTKPLRYAVSTSGILKATGMSSKTAYTYVSHKAMATGLAAGTTYSYRVGQAGYWSPIQQFTTAQAGKDAFKFVVMSDSHIMDAEYVTEAHKCAVAAAAHAEDAAFMVFPGDFVETGTDANSEWEWEQWFEAMQPMLSKFTCAPTDGNHDDSPNLNYVYHFNTDKSFNEQAKIKPQFDGITYSFVYGDALIMVYSHQDYWRGNYSYTTGVCSYLTNDVAPWFRQQCAAHPECKWRIAVVHKNMFCGSGHQEDEDGALFRATLLPVFRELNIDLAIQGHDHTYEVMGPIDINKQVVAGAVENVETVPVNTNTNMTGKAGGTFNVDEGTMFYVGATCGRKRYYPYTREQMEANYDKTHVTNYFDLFTGRFGQPGAPTYTEVTVSSDSIRLEAYTADAEGNSTLFDAFTVVRKERQAALPQVTTESGCSKVLSNGQILILRGDVAYTLLGARY